VGNGPPSRHVSDERRGIPHLDREEVFERGVTTAVTCTRFGLAIGLEMISAHGWDLSATESDEGGARIEIPGVETP
jgi:K+-sensing histidine kinase KdpD